MRDLKGPVTMVVWPKAAHGSKDITPSPVMDALGSATTELTEACSRLNAEALINEDNQSKHRYNSKLGQYSERSLHSVLTISTRIFILSFIHYCQ
jgi:hypothetical protein